jgi:hypothetical protein
MVAMVARMTIGQRPHRGTIEKNGLKAFVSAVVWGW